ncbi:MAG: cyanophycinase [Vicinamibacterales bacterium]
MTFLLLVLLLSPQRAAPLPPAAPRTVHHPTPGYDTYLTGNAADVSRPTTGGLQLEGGGTDIPEAFRWLIAHAGGGDIVVIRASGADGYNGFISGLGEVDSVESIVFHRREAAFDPEVLAKLERAEAVFIAGGDQANYVRYWKDTPVQATLNALARRGVPIGGTSAGLAILGEFAFVALEDTVTSAEALADPYGKKVTLDRGFLSLPHLARIITDSHFVPRDRLGRLLVFLGRIVQDGWSATARAIAVDQEAALLVEANGSARVVGKGPVYFMATTEPPVLCRAGVPLTMNGIATVRVAPGGTFDLTTWSGPGATPYRLSVEAGKVSSSSGAIY